jgi:hypothetical protein
MSAVSMMKEEKMTCLELCEVGGVEVRLRPDEICEG